MNKAFFLDRDGTINVDFDYVHKKEEWKWCDGAIEALQWMKKKGFLILIVTNQSGIARGRYTRRQVDELHAWVDSELAAYDIKIDHWYVAPWHPEFHGDRPETLLQERKPGTALFKRARKEFDIDFSRSFMAGDKISDLKPAVKLGMTSFFIRSRHERFQDMKWLKNRQIPVCDSLLEATRIIEKSNTHE